MPGVDRKLLLTEADLILLALLKGEKKITDLRPATGLSTTSIYHNVDRLLRSGLVEEDREKVPGTRILRLTEKGRRVARILRALEEEVRPKIYVLEPE